MKKRLLCMMLAGLLAASLSGCGKKTEVALPLGPEPDAPVIAEPEVPEKPYVPSGTNPLTGLPMEEICENNRPVAVMLNNLKAAQPQLGTAKADIIYEIPAEGGITRMLAVYQSLEGVEVLGSIRSARAYYMEVATGHDAVYVHAGGSPEAYEDLQAWKMDHMDGVNGGSDAEIFWRDAQRRKTAGYEHSMMTSGENILGYLSKGRFRTEHQGDYAYDQTFVKDGTPVNGTAATQVTLRFSPYKTGKFDYNPATGQYLVSQYGTEYVDGNTGEQVGATNLLVLETALSVIPGDTAGRLQVKLTGGRGTYFCGGRSVPIEWSKMGRNSPFAYTLESGEPLRLGQGNSYICIMSPKTSTLSFE